MENYVKNFWQYYTEESDNYTEKMPDYAAICKINSKVVPLVFPNV